VLELYEPVLQVRLKYSVAMYICTALAVYERTTTDLCRTVSLYWHRTYVGRRLLMHEERNDDRSPPIPPVRFTYTRYFFGQRVFFSRNILVISIFSHDLLAKRTGLSLVTLLVTNDDLCSAKFVKHCYCVGSPLTTHHFGGLCKLCTYSMITTN